MTVCRGTGPVYTGVSRLGRRPGFGLSWGVLHATKSPARKSLKPDGPPLTLPRWGTAGRSLSCGSRSSRRIGEGRAARTKWCVAER
jgi:hypothetical protein